MPIAKATGASSLLPSARPLQLGQEMLRLRPFPMMLVITGGCSVTKMFSPLPLWRMPGQERNISRFGIIILDRGFFGNFLSWNYTIILLTTLASWLWGCQSFEFLKFLQAFMVRRWWNLVQWNFLCSATMKWVVTVWQILCELPWNSEHTLMPPWRWFVITLTLHSVLSCGQTFNWT